MWHQFIEPIHVAVILFPLIAIGMTVPLFAYHYHRYGAISRWQVFVNYSFFFYLLCAYFLIIMPLPSRASVAALTTPAYNLHPLLVYHIFRDTGFSLHNAATWVPTLHTAGFQQPFFNVMLTIPFGFYLHYYFKRGFFTTVLLSFCLSLFFETTQLTGLYGLYVRPYRLFDVDDLLLNTLGGFAGWLGAPLFSWLLPSRERIATANAKRAHQVGLLRRFTAFLIDWLLIGTFCVISATALSAFGANVPIWILAVIAIGLLILLPEGLFNGYTIGLRAVYLQIRATDWHKPTWLQILIRNVICYGALLLIMIGIAHAFNRHGQFTGLGFLGGLALILLIGVLIDALLTSWITSYPLLFERLSRTTTISSFVGDDSETVKQKTPTTPAPKKFGSNNNPTGTTRTQRYHSR